MTEEGMLTCDCLLWRLLSPFPSHCESLLYSGQLPSAPRFKGTHSYNLQSSKKSYDFKSTMKEQASRQAQQLDINEVNLGYATKPRNAITALKGQFQPFLLHCQIWDIWGPILTSIAQGHRLGLDSSHEPLLLLEARTLRECQHDSFPLETFSRT